MANHKRGLAPRDHPIYFFFHLPKAVLDSKRTTVQYRIYWTVSKRGYGHSAHAVPTDQSSVNVLNENIINISPFTENTDMFSDRLICKVNNIFNIGWLTVQYRLYWTQITYIGLGCASSNIAFFVQYNLYWTVNHPLLYNIRWWFSMEDVFVSLVDILTHTVKFPILPFPLSQCSRPIIYDRWRQ